MSTAVLIKELVKCIEPLHGIEEVEAVLDSQTGSVEHRSVLETNTQGVVETGVRAYVDVTTEAFSLDLNRHPKPESSSL